MKGALIVVFGLAAMFGSAKAVDVAALPPPPSAVAADGQAPGARALDASVAAFSHGRFTTGQGRYFRVAAGANWQMIVKLLAEQRPLQGNARRVRFGWERPGFDLVELFDMGGDRGVALAMTDDLVGYFPVTFDHQPREYLDPRRPS